MAGFFVFLCFFLFFSAFFGGVVKGISVGILMAVLVAAQGAYAASADSASAAHVAASASEQTCRACHTIDSTKVGPGFRAISERYRGQADAVAKLQFSILHGSAGKWNTGAQMPPNDVSVAEAERFAKWVLSVR
ncbi:cytochrome C [Paraburkholderia sp. D15]|uniref:c-type cytochrome n=1 Tax=Paraburkholderia sp. D15 TaxID=2880218 RepID=UPI002478DF45|nr:c-type cytochrome [Paraburkholderia sp. D15]WGS51229.1 cytochrome C [Paraburkholderia sp. D15]